MIRSLNLTVLLFLVMACSSKHELGSSELPLKLYLPPGMDSEATKKQSSELISFLQSETGLFFKTTSPPNYIASVEALGSLHADIAFMNSFGYLLANQKYAAEARLMALHDGEKDYQGQIIAHIDSGIKKIEDITGKSFAFTNASSITGHMLPMKMLNAQNVKPKYTVFAMNDDNVLAMVYKKQIDAGATGFKLKAKFPDFDAKVKLISLSEKIPNEPFVFRKNLPPEITKKIIAALEKYLSSESGKNTVQGIYNISGVVPCTDADYEPLKNTLKALNLEPATLLTEGKK